MKIIEIDFVQCLFYAILCVENRKTLSK